MAAKLGFEAIEYVLKKVLTKKGVGGIPTIPGKAFAMRMKQLVDEMANKMRALGYDINKVKEKDVQGLLDSAKALQKQKTKAEALQKFPKETHKFFGRPLTEKDFKEIDRLYPPKKDPFQGFTPKIVPKETEAQVKARLLKTQKETLERLKQKKKPEEPEFASGGIAGELHLNDGGRAGFDKGKKVDLGKRRFLKGTGTALGVLSALPVVGKFFKLAKPAATVASKTPMIAQSPEYLGTLIEVLRSKGIEKITKLGDKITEYKGVVLEEQPGRIEVYRKGKKKEGYHEVLEGTEDVKDEGLETAKIIQGEDEYFGKVSKKGDEDLIEIADEIKGMVPDADEWIQPVRFNKSINPRLQTQHDYWADIDKKVKKDNFASGGLVELLSL